MNKDVAEFCLSCGACHMTKSLNQRPAGLLHSLPIPTRPWESIAMDFLGPFPSSNGHDYLLVVIDRFSSMVHLIPTTTKVKATEVAGLFMREVVRLHGMPRSIVSDRDSKFISQFWQELHRILGIKLLMSSAYHPQTDGATERANRTVAQILRAIVDSDQKDWSHKLPMAEYAINAAISSTLKLSPFEVNYGWSPSLLNLPRGDDAEFPGVRKFVDLARRNVSMAHDAIIASRVDQTHDANTRRREDPDIKVGDLVYVSTSDMNLPRGRARKLMVKCIGPYEVLRASAEQSSYELKLPPELAKRRIHPVYHVSKLRPYIANDDDRFPRREARFFYDFGNDPEAEWVVASIDDHAWVAKPPHWEFHVQWEAGDSTWEPHTSVKSLAALDNYLELMGVPIPSKLLKKERAKE